MTQRKNMLTKIIKMYLYFYHFFQSQNPQTPNIIQTSLGQIQIQQQQQQPQPQQQQQQTIQIHNASGKCGILRIMIYF
jgi:hypothetical protein